MRLIQCNFSDTIELQPMMPSCFYVARVNVCLFSLGLAAHSDCGTPLMFLLTFLFCNLLYKDLRDITVSAGNGCFY